ncbi:hypothetical protein Lal_00041675 [Lupinus albus]|nr:hypothetical protein Lal_00041675 [Lupinus albus]
MSCLHCARIPPNHVNVSIDIVIDGNALLPIPFDEDIVTLGEAIGTFVPWPVDLVDVVPTMENGIVEHSATSPPRVEHASKKDKVVMSKLKKNKPRSKSSYKESRGEVVSKKANFCAKLMKHIQNLLDDFVIRISFPLHDFGYSADKFIGNNEMKDIYDHDWIGASAICVYIKYLYDNLIFKNKKKVMFLSPHSTTLVSNNDKRKKKQAQHVAEILIKHKDAANLFIAPFNIGPPVNLMTKIAAIM